MGSNGFCQLAAFHSGGRALKGKTRPEFPASGPHVGTSGPAVLQVAAAGRFEGWRAPLVWEVRGVPVGSWGLYQLRRH